jgi:hypothetical protein
LQCASMHLFPNPSEYRSSTLKWANLPSPFRENDLRVVRLKDSSLILAVGAIETRKACTGAILVVTDTSARAIPASLIAVPIEGICARRTFLQLASGAAVASVAETTNMLHCIPRGIVFAISLDGKVLLRPASATVVAVIRAGRTLASNTVIAREALARTRLAVTCTLVRALHPRVEIVRVDDISDPSEIARASAKTAIRASPLGLAVETCEALAVAILLTRSVVGTVVLTETAIAMPALVPCDLSPTLDCIGGSSGRGFGICRAASRAATRSSFRIFTFITRCGQGNACSATVVGGTQDTHFSGCTCVTVGTS